MIERLFTNIKTTIVGLIIFVTGAMLVAFDKASSTEFGAFSGVAFSHFFSKAPNQKSK